MTQGVDFAFGPLNAPPGQFTFAARYFAFLPNDKVLTLSEAQNLAKLGWWLVANWEEDGTGLVSGDAAYQAQVAQAAVAQAKACQVPAGRPIYFSVDEQADQSTFPTILANLKLRAAAIAPYQVGVYGEAALISYLAANGFHWLWQANAWSNGATAPQAIIVQQLGQVTVAGVTCDVDHALVAEFGQWQPGKSPTPPAPPPPPPFTGTVVGIAATPTGYLVLLQDGGVLNYATPWYGSPKASGIDSAAHQPVGIATAPNGGYWVATAEGNVYNYGVAWYGSAAASGGNPSPIVGIAAAPSGNGYWLTTKDGGVLNYGTKWLGSPRA